MLFWCRHLRSVEHAYIYKRTITLLPQKHWVREVSCLFVPAAVVTVVILPGGVHLIPRVFVHLGIVVACTF